MKKAYENPVAEKIVFDYTNSVAASGPLNLFGTPEEPWCHKAEIGPNQCGNQNERCTIPN